MSTAGGIRAGRAYVELYGEDSSLKTTLDDDEGAVKAWGQRIGQIGSSISGALSSGIGAIGTMAGTVTAAAAGIAAATLSAVSFGGGSKSAATDVDRISVALERLTPVSTRAFDKLSAGIFAGANGLLQFSNLLQDTGPAGVAVSDGIDRITSSYNRLLMVHRTSPLGQAAFRGGLFSQLIGDEAGTQFYAKLGRIANAARVADAFQQGPIQGLREALDVGVKRGLTMTLGGAARGFNALSGGILGLFARTFKAIGHAAGGGDLGTVLAESANGAVPKVSLLARTVTGVGTAFNKAWSLGRSALDSFRQGIDSLSHRGMVIAGVAGSLVGLMSAAAGIDLRSITSRLMNIQSFASGAKDLQKGKGTGISTADVTQAKALQKSMDRMGDSIQVLWAQVGAAVAPIVTKSLDGISRLVQGTASWAQANRPLIASLFEVARRIFTIATVSTIAAKAIGLMSGLLAALGGGPMSFVAVALATGIGLWLAWTESGQKAVGWLQERFGQLVKTFDTAWTGIINAISAGRIELAAKIAWAGIKLAFLETIKALGGSWSGFQALWTKSVYLIGDVWDRVFARVKKGWNNAQNFLAKGISVLLGMLEGKSAAQRQQAIDILEQDRQHEETKVDKEMKASIAQRQKQLEEDLAKLPAGDQAEIDRLRQQLQDLTDRARAAAADSPLKDFDLKKVSQGIHTQGTFNAASVRSLASGGPMDQIAKNTKKTATHAEAIQVGILKLQTPKFN